MRHFLAALFLCLLLPTDVVGKPSRIAVEEFRGDRWMMVAQGVGNARDITGAMRHAPMIGVPRAKKRKWRHRPRHERAEVASRSSAVIRDRRASVVPLPRARPAEEMDAEQVAAYRVIADLLAGGKVFVRPVPDVIAPVRKNIFEGFRDEILKAAQPAGRSLAGIVKPLADKIMSVASVCPDMKVISTVRPGAVVRGSGRPSLHRYGKAVDIAGDYRCIYAALKTFAGGVSTDAHRVRHVHVSWDPKGREWGRRFAHWQPGKRRYVRRHHRQQYASARGS